jgi:hypothetical protein
MIADFRCNFGHFAQPGNGTNGSRLIINRFDGAITRLRLARLSPGL